MHVGNTLRMLRQLKGLKQEIVARRLKISQPAYSKIENSKYLSEKRFFQLLSILEISKDEFDQTFKYFLQSSVNQIKNYESPT